MRPDRMIQTRRKAPKSTFTMLYAATRSIKRRKQRAATTATPEETGEVPGVGIARALVVILLIHIAAIAGIYLHNKGSNSDLKAAIPITDKDKGPTLLEGYDRGIPNVGENYSKMAQRYGVDEQELRRLNEDKPIKAGWKYNIPARRTEVTTPAESVVGQVNPPVETALPTPVERPMIQTSDTTSRPGSSPGALVAVESNLPPRPAPTPDAILIKPRPAPTPEPAPAAEVMSSSKTHVVQGGETLWGICRKNGVSVDAIMSLNGIKNASALKIGAVLKIPVQR
ncbi:MAG: LysM peptidoglycan-binding domain-containing protein [Akkermansiaceae bacterium]